MQTTNTSGFESGHFADTREQGLAYLIFVVNTIQPSLQVSLIGDRTNGVGVAKVTKSTLNIMVVGDDIGA